MRNRLRKDPAAATGSVAVSVGAGELQSKDMGAESWTAAQGKLALMLITRSQGEASIARLDGNLIAGVADLNRTSWA